MARQSTKQVKQARKQAKPSARKVVAQHATTARVKATRSTEGAAPGGNTWSPATDNELPPGFKMTELGPLPEEWEVCRLGELIEPVKTKIPRDRFDGSIPIVQKIPFASGTMILRDSRRTRTDLVICPAGTLLVSKINLHQGAIAINESETVGATTHYSVYRVGSHTDIRWLWRFLRTTEFLATIQEIRDRGFKKEANYKFIERLPIPRPSLAEQRAIAAVLNRVRRAIEATEKVITAARELKKSLMKHLFTYGPVPIDQADQVPLKETEVGPVPEHWQVFRLEELLREPLRNGHSARESETGEGIRTLILSAVTRNDFSIANTKVTVADAKRVANLWLEPEDILVERANTADLVGTAAMYEGPKAFSIFPDLTVRVRTNGRVDPKYLVEFMGTLPCRTHYRARARKTAGNMPKIDHGTINSTPVPLAKKVEQARIAMTLRAAEEKVTAERVRKSALEAIFNTLLHELMAGQVRVKDWNLEEVRA